VNCPAVTVKEVVVEPETDTDPGKVTGPVELNARVVAELGAALKETVQVTVPPEATVIGSQVRQVRLITGAATTVTVALEVAEP
jgi:hypothetical protein